MEIIEAPACANEGIKTVGTAPTTVVDHWNVGEEEGEDSGEDDGVSFDIRGFLPIEIDHISTSFAHLESQAIILSAELAKAHEALHAERRRRIELEQVLNESDTSRASLQALNNTLEESNAALRRGSEGERALSLTRVAGLEADVARLQGSVSRLETENAMHVAAINDLKVSLRLAENKSRRLEYQLQEQDDDNVELRLFLQSSLHTMNKQAHADKRGSPPSKLKLENATCVDCTTPSTGTGKGRNAKVKRLLERVKASDGGVDVTNLTVSEVQGFLSLLVHRMNESSVSSC